MRTKQGIEQEIRILEKQRLNLSHLMGLKSANTKELLSINDFICDKIKTLQLELIAP